MKDEMSADLRRLVDGARGADAPTAADRDRVRAALVAGLAAGGGAASGGASKLGLLGRAGLVVLVGALLAGGVWWFASTSGGDAHRVAATAPVREPEPAPIAEPPALILDAAPIADAAPRQVATSERPKPRAPRDAAQLAEEARLLREAETARRAGELERASQKLDEHRRRFPRGVLATERDAARVLLLCDAGRIAEAKKLAGSFLRRHPRSPLADRVRSACERSIP
jgi:hypothetical protein